jgi:hypothetical protein
MALLHMAVIEEGYIKRVVAKAFNVKVIINVCFVTNDAFFEWLTAQGWRKRMGSPKRVGYSCRYK